MGIRLLVAVFTAIKTSSEHLVSQESISSNKHRPHFVGTRMIERGGVRKKDIEIEGHEEQFKIRKMGVR